MRLEHLRDVVVNMIRADTPDLTQRQLAILLTVTTGGPNTVRGLALALLVSRPAVTRSLDRLEELGHARRVTDPADRRSVLVNLTKAGEALVKLMQKEMAEAIKT